MFNGHGSGEAACGSARLVREEIVVGVRLRVEIDDQVVDEFPVVFPANTCSSCFLSAASFFAESRGHGVFQGVAHLRPT